MNKLIREQVKSILATWEFWILCVVAIIIVLAQIIPKANMAQVQITANESFISTVGGSRYGLFVRVFDNISYIFPVACGLAVGASFAIDRKTKIAQYILTRGFRKWQYLLAKAAAMILCSMLLIVLVQGVTWIASSALARYPTVQSFEGAGGRVGSSEDLFFHRVPGQYVFLFALLQLLTTAAIATVSLLVAALGGNAWVSIITPIGLWFFLDNIFNENALAFLNPGFKVRFLWWDPSLLRKPVAYPPFLQSSFACWGILLLLNVVFTALVYLRQEDA